MPNATGMVILDADRFGLSQLHQLRGRVGRGAAPGVCLLVTDVPAGHHRPRAARRGGRHHRRLRAGPPGPGAAPRGRRAGRAAVRAAAPGCGCCRCCATRRSSRRRRSTRPTWWPPTRPRRPPRPAALVGETVGDEERAAYLDKVSTRAPSGRHSAAPAGRRRLSPLAEAVAGAHLPRVPQLDVPGSRARTGGLPGACRAGAASTVPCTGRRLPGGRPEMGHQRRGRSRPPHDADLPGRGAALSRATAPRPNFVVLLGRRYGWRPVPAEIPSALFERVLEVSEAGGRILRSWYVPDTNAVPPRHRLREREAGSGDWGGTEAELLSVLEDAGLRLAAEGFEHVRFGLSATEQEIELGASSTDPRIGCSPTSARRRTTDPSRPPTGSATCGRDSARNFPARFTSTRVIDFPTTSTASVTTFCAISAG